MYLLFKVKATEMERGNEGKRDGGGAGEGEDDGVGRIGRREGRKQIE